MLKFFAARKGHFFVSSPVLLHNSAVGNFLFFLLLAGILSGCVFSVYSQFTTDGLDSFFSVLIHGESSFLSVLLLTGKYIFLVILSATSYLGVITIPALVLVRGCALGSAIASYYAALGTHGLLKALVFCGVTELLTLPVMMLLSERLVFNSHMLLRLRLGKRVIRDYPLNQQRILITVFILFLLSIVYQCAILPLIHI